MSSPDQPLNRRLMPVEDRVWRSFSQDRIRRVHTPVVFVYAGRWLPGTVTGWVKSAAGWYCRIRYRYSETRDTESWVEFNPMLVLRLSVDQDDLKNWLPQRPIG